MFSRKALDLSGIVPTSKLSLKMSCLAACNNDVKEASALYDFIAEGMDLPDVDPVRPTTLSQIRQGAEDVYGWIASHKDELVEAWQFIRTLKPAAPVSGVPSGVPPIPKV